MTIIDKIIKEMKYGICGICGRYSADFLCPKCRSLLTSQSKFEIQHMEKEKNSFDELFYVFEYHGIIRELILKYKFGDAAYLYKTFANYIIKNEKFFEILRTYDTIIPVPISKKRMKQRGYNQSQLITKEIAKNTHLYHENKCIYKIKDVIAQSTLNKEQRKMNIKDAYKLKNYQKISNNIKGKKIIIFDDIYTTGSTLNECCKLLRQANVEKISALVIAKD